MSFPTSNPIGSHTICGRSKGIMIPIGYYVRERKGMQERNTSLIILSLNRVLR